MKIKITKKETLDEISAMGGGAVHGHVDNKKDLKESEVTSDILQNDSDGYFSDVTFNGTTPADDEYQVVQSLSIKNTGFSIQRHMYPEIYEAIRKCLPNNIEKTSFGEKLKTFDIDFKILHIEVDGEPLEFDLYDENIFSEMDSLRFFRHIMKEVGEYITSNPDKVYYFYGIHGDSEQDDPTMESMRTKLYKMFLKKLYKLLPGDWRTMTLKSVNQLLFWKCPDREQASLVFENKQIDFTNEEIDLIYEMYSTSGAMMGSGSGQGPYERSEEGHERFIDMRFRKQGLQNCKPSKYFAEGEENKKKIKIKIRKNLGERCQKGYKTHKKRKTKKMFGKRYRNCVKAEAKSPVSKEISKLMKKKGMEQEQAVAIALSMKEKGKLKEEDPKKGTGKKPKGSGRRLYTDENPKDTVSVKFSTVQDVKDTFSKASFKSKSHKRQSQIINLVHQRARAAYQNAKDPEVKKRLKKAYDYAAKRKEASKKKTQSMKKKK